MPLKVRNKVKSEHLAATNRLIAPCDFAYQGSHKSPVKREGATNYVAAFEAETLLESFILIDILPAERI